MNKNFWHVRFIVGFIFIIIGCAVILDRYTFVSFGWIMGLIWPVLIVYLGAQILKRNRNSKFGLFIVIIGGILLIANILPGISAGSLILPSIIIGIGLFIIYSGIRGNDHPKVTRSKTKDDKIDTFTTFWGLEKKVLSKNFKGGEINVVFGSADIDLREAIISQKGAHLNVSAVFGAIEILIPKNANVVVKGDGFAGTFEDKSSQNETKDGPEIIIDGNAVFGAVEIK